MSASRLVMGKEAARRGRLRVAVCVKRLPGNRQGSLVLLVIRARRRVPGIRVPAVGMRGREPVLVIRQPGNRLHKLVPLAIRVRRRAHGIMILAVGMSGIQVAVRKRAIVTMRIIRNLTSQSVV